MKTLDDVMKKFENKFCDPDKNDYYDADTYDSIRSFLRKAITDAVIGELEGLEVESTACKEFVWKKGKKRDCLQCRECFENLVDAEWRQLRDSRISALRKKL